MNLVQHLRLVASHSYPNAPVARARPRYPVLIFSHGYASSPWQNTVQMEELASHGFIVFSIGHTYESVAIRFPDGRIAPLNRARMKSVTGDRSKLKELATQSLGVWVADTRYVADELAKIEQHKQEHPKRYVFHDRRVTYLVMGVWTLAGLVRLVTSWQPIALLLR